MFEYVHIFEAFILKIYFQLRFSNKIWNALPNLKKLREHYDFVCMTEQEKRRLHK